MAQVISRILNYQYFGVISGGSYAQFTRQFLPFLESTDNQLKHLVLFPVNGSQCFVFEDSQWKKLYQDTLTEDEKMHIRQALSKALEHAPRPTRIYGEQIEDRESQIAFSWLGQEAPIEEKELWDPDQKKRQEVVSHISPELTEYEITIGGTTTIDITKKGVNKAYAIRKLCDVLHVTSDDILFFGDALYEHGNDAPAKETGVQCVSVEGPEETLRLLTEYVDNVY
jgi:HAD superfamily hydrolase (TIGR01484 family)